MFVYVYISIYLSVYLSNYLSISVYYTVVITTHNDPLLSLGSETRICNDVVNLKNMFVYNGNIGYFRYFYICQLFKE